MTEHTEEELQEMSRAKDSFIQRWGLVITESGGESCKGGAYSYPGALDRYERALGLKPAEAWLIKRLLSRDWDGKGYVWLSLRKISEEADVSYGELLKLKESLELKGYIRDMGQHSSGAFSQVRNWSIAGFLTALKRTIACDPSTEYAKQLAETKGHKITMADYFTFANGKDKGKPFEPFKEFTTAKQVNEWNASEGHVTPWEGGTSPSVPKPQKRDRKEHTCPDCGKVFQTGSRNPMTRCTTCRKKNKRLSLKELVSK